ncbi:hypothetical protein D3C76_1123830 [compost metagenome]
MRQRGNRLAVGQGEVGRRLAQQHGDSVFELRTLPDQVNQVSLGAFELRTGLGHGIRAGDTGAVLVFVHSQRALISRHGGFQQALLLIDHPQLQVVLHQLRLLAQADRRKVGETRFGTGLVGIQGFAQLAPQVDLPAHAQLRVVGVANAAAVIGQAGTGAAGALRRTVLAGAQVQAGEQRRTAAAHQRLGLAVLGF